MMPRLTPEARLIKAEKDKAAAISQLRSAAGQISAKKRKMDTRRKIILGGLLMKEAENPNTAKWIKAAISRLSDRDKAAFADYIIPSPPPKSEKK